MSESPARIVIPLEDCSSRRIGPGARLQEGLWFNAADGAFVLQAVQMLQEKINGGEVEFLSLSGRRRIKPLEPVVSGVVTGTGTSYKSSIVREMVLTTSRYVGEALIRVAPECSNIQGKDILFQIRPRFGGAVFDRLLSYACGVYLPKELQGAGHAPARTNDANSHWLLFLMWFCAFRRACRACSIPRAYVPVSRNLRAFRGRLDVIRQIQENLTDQSRFYCDYRPLSMDVPINRTIRYVYKLLSNAGMMTLRPGTDEKGSVDRFLPGLALHDERLASFGVGNAPVSPEEIDRISYTRMTEPYRPLMQLSKALILSFGTSDFRTPMATPAYFIDFSEIWENYLLQLCQKNLPGYTFISPNESSRPIHLFENDLRPIRPDFLVYKDGRLVAVMDAKYKSQYLEIGKYGNSFGAVSREDLYQMVTYLYHHGREKDGRERKLLGIFLSPCKDLGKKPETLAGHSGHKMAFCNLELPSAVDTGKIENQAVAEVLREREQDFIERLKGMLESCGECH